MSLGIRSRRVARWLAGAAISAAAIAWVVVAARRAASEPARCAEGMVLLGPRCCGAGQHLDGDRCAGTPTSCARGLVATDAGCTPKAPAVRIEIEGGMLAVAPSDWEATGLITPRRELVTTFALDAYEVDEARYAACSARGACAAPRTLRGEPGLPVTDVTAAEAEAFCRDAGGRLPTETELAYAAAGPGGRRYPWGTTGFVCRRAAWGLVDGPCAAGATGPEIVGAHPAGASPEGAHDLSGNVAEWTLSGNVAEWTLPVSGRAFVLGGSYRDVEAAALRTWGRRAELVDRRSSAIGFRCAYASGNRSP